MKVLLGILITVLFFALIIPAGAQVVDGVLQVPKTDTPPVIDGKIEPVWYSVTNTRMLIWRGLPDDWLDYYTTFRVMWDNDNIYFLVNFMDSQIEADGSDNWANDGIEVYFDSGNEKATTYDDNDKQWRWVYKEATGNPSVGGETFAWMDDSLGQGETMGYTLELAIPATDLESAMGFKLEAGHVFGFEMQGNDRDDGGRQTESKWWSSSGNSWKDASLFGTAVLSDAPVSGDALIVPKVSTPLSIDGDDSDWDAVPVLSSFIRTTYDLYEQDDWTDIKLDFRIAWDDNNFYFFGNFIDDAVYTDNSANWQNDGIELFFDGSNEKTSTYDDNDIQWRWVHGEATGNPSAGGETFVWVDNDTGYTFELAIPAADLQTNIGMPLELNHVFGFDIQFNDNDDGNRQSETKWWSDSGNSWKDASVFGTAKLGAEISTEVEAKSDGLVARDFALEQNYPNPFNPTTEIAYSVAAKTNVILTVFNVLGHEINTLVNEVKLPGTYKVTFNASGLSSGVYFYRLKAGSDVLTKKMLLVR